MYRRHLEPKILEAKEKYPVLAIVGPRQTGKTTLARHLFAEFKYVLLEDLEIAAFAKNDPKGFFQRFGGSLVLDEVQKVPELLSYIQGIVDTPNNTRQFVLTGSEHLLLSEKIAQSLAGRVRIFTLLPLSQKELGVRALKTQILQGGYPRIHDQGLNPVEWLGDYYSTYVERDIRTVIGVSSIDLFDRVVRLCASRVGQLIDYTNISNGAGVTAPTVKGWISALKATFICFQLEPHFQNFNKRLIKSPKLFFFDTGLLCYLLRIHSEKELEAHPLFGQIFENWVISECLKANYNQAKPPHHYFWRDQKMNEVDLVLDQGGRLYPIEIKSSMTFHHSFLKSLDYLNRIQNTSGGQVIYGGDETYTYKDYQITSWREL